MGIFGGGGAKREKQRQEKGGEKLVHGCGTDDEILRANLRGGWSQFFDFEALMPFSPRQQKKEAKSNQQMFKLISLSLLSVASARTLRTSEDPAPVKIEDMAKFVGVSAKSEEASTKGGPVDWPPAGIGDVSRKKPVF